MNPTSVSRQPRENVPVEESPHSDLKQLWDLAGRPKGRSPRQWRRSTLGRAAVELFAARRGVGPEAIILDSGGPKGHVLADVAVAAVYAAALDPKGANEVLAALEPYDLADARRLLVEEARRRAEVEQLRDEYRVLINAVDRVRAGVYEPWAGPDARPGDPRPRGAPPLGDPDHACSACGSGVSVFLAAVRPELWLCPECRRR